MGGRDDGSSKEQWMCPICSGQLQESTLYMDEVVSDVTIIVKTTVGADAPELAKILIIRIHGIPNFRHEPLLIGGGDAARWRELLTPICQYLGIFNARGQDDHKKAL
ncbi:hypothetical protein GPALN_007762 [Globodera pallida]|nr:hypothetical protein GPALN_007762 [Globodera pallida]